MITLLILLSRQPRACSLHEKLPYSLIMFTSLTPPRRICFSVSTKQISKAILWVHILQTERKVVCSTIWLKGIQPLNFSSKWILVSLLLIFSLLILQLCAFCPSSPTLSLPQRSPFPFLFLSLFPLKALCSDDMLQALSDANLLYSTTSRYLILRDLWNQKWPKGRHRREDGQERKRKAGSERDSITFRFCD